MGAFLDRTILVIAVSLAMATVLSRTTVIDVALAQTGATVAIQANKDNTLYEDAAGSLANGAGQHMFAGNTGGGSARRGLIAFDIAASIPAGATIGGVTLTLNLSRSAAGAEVVELRRLDTDWGEGPSDAPGSEGSGADAAIGDATWLHTFYDSATWASAGGDFSDTASATITVGDEGAYSWDSPEMVADVQDWLDSPSSNFGWLLLGNEATEGTAKRFDSKDNETSENRPELMVAFTTGEEPSPTPIPRAPVTGDAQIARAGLAVALLGLIFAVGGLGLLAARRASR